MNPKELLTNVNFVNSLARSLVMDEHHAADVAQETWLAALRHPPRAGKQAYSWFFKVVRNFSISLYRSENRRRAREESAARPEGPPTPEEIVEKIEMRRILADAVLSLKEPYRSSIVLRFYEGLSCKEMARRLGVPSATVRTRINRGIDHLRNSLDVLHGGSREKWRLGFAPIAAANATGVPVAVKALVVAIIIVGISFSFWSFNSKSPGDQNHHVSGTLDVIENGSSPEIMGDKPTTDSAEKITIPYNRRMINISGSVQSLVDNKKLSGGKVRISPLPHLGTEIELESQTDQNGEYFASIPIHESRPLEGFHITINARGYLELETKSYLTGSNGSHCCDVLYLTRNSEYIVEVRDLSGEPVKGAKALICKPYPDDMVKEIVKYSDKDGNLILTTEDLCFEGALEPCMLQITANGMAPYYSREFDERNPPEKAILEPRRLQSFKVVDEVTLAPVNNARIMICFSPPGIYCPENRIMGLSGQDGLFSFHQVSFSDDLVEKKCHIFVVADGYIETCINQNLTEKGLRFPEEIHMHKITHSMQVCVKDSYTLKPIEGVQLKLSQIDDHEILKTDKSGCSHCPVSGDLDIPVILSHPGYQTSITLLSPSSMRDSGIRDIKLKAIDRCEMQIKVADEIGKPLVRAKITLEPNHDIDQIENGGASLEKLVKVLERTKHTNLNGEALFGPGSFNDFKGGSIAVTRPGFLPITLPFIIAGGSTEVEVVLKRGRLYQKIRVIGSDGWEYPCTAANASLIISNHNTVKVSGYVDKNGYCRISFPEFIEGRIYLTEDSDPEGAVVKGAELVFSQDDLTNNRWLVIKPSTQILCESLIQGVVRDLHGNPLKDVEVGDLITDPSIIIKKTKTDEHGAFSFTALEKDKDHLLAFAPFAMNNRLYVKLDKEKAKAGASLSATIPSYNYVLIDYKVKDINESIYYLMSKYWLEYENKEPVRVLISLMPSTVNLGIGRLPPHKVCFVGVPPGRMRAVIETRNGHRYYSDYFDVRRDESPDFIVGIDL